MIGEQETIFEAWNEGSRGGIVNQEEDEEEKEDETRRKSSEREDAIFKSILNLIECHSHLHPSLLSPSFHFLSSSSSLIMAPTATLTKASNFVASRILNSFLCMWRLTVSSETRVTRMEAGNGKGHKIRRRFLSHFIQTYFSILTSLFSVLKELTKWWPRTSVQNVQFSPFPAFLNLN